MKWSELRSKKVVLVSNGNRVFWLIFEPQLFKNIPTLRSFKHTEVGKVNTPDHYKIVIHVESRTIGKHARKCNAPEFFVIEVIILELDNEYLSMNIIVSQKIVAINRDENGALNNLSIIHRTYNPLSCSILCPDQRGELHKGMLIPYAQHISSTFLDIFHLSPLQSQLFLYPVQ